MSLISAGSISLYSTFKGSVERDGSAMLQDLLQVSDTLTIWRLSLITGNFRAIFTMKKRRVRTVGLISHPLDN
jgi:hypothetical protein